MRIRFAKINNENVDLIETVNGVVIEHEGLTIGISLTQNNQLQIVKTTPAGTNLEIEVVNNVQIIFN